MNPTNLTLKQGDTHFLEAVITRIDGDGIAQPVDLAPPTTKLWFTVKKKPSDADSAAYIQKGTTSASLTGIDIENASAGEALITLDPEDTDDAGNGTQFYTWDLQLKEEDDVVTTVAGGRLALTEEVTSTS